MRRTRAVCAVLAAAVLLSACEYANPVYADRAPGSNRSVIRDLSKPYERDTVFGPDGVDLFGSGDDRPAEGGGGIGVNSFLWRASLDTIAFMPLTSADPFGGVIITDWYTPPESPDERFKVNVYILARALRADGIEVSVFKQRRPLPADGGTGTSTGAGGGWTDIPVEEAVGTELEDTILTRARQLRMAALRDR
ncbi:DUF3576 domain-containing protein [Roseospira marina]|uniref:DUF3576 domain-containing protein n=1 Tax=Roseospira marina TaxID=140057 RepID=A0A5M6I7D3_9PROT|nr:DUF3576 domain-containing protein [Roseospira marina]KAA5604171.1 DUF3576 domain-containing protein [Roseospira marina]MBB4315731.1 hypothetical protein [Roseospira marina]MBB5088898.1 hypothetical protein [Roseospira marina]